MAHRAWALGLVILGGCYGSEGLTGDGDHDPAADPVDSIFDPDVIHDTIDSWPDTRPDTPPDEPPDLPPDIPPDATCVTQGCWRLDMSLSCCPGLTGSTECPPTDPGCNPSQFCIRTGDGICDPHETRFNSWEDCMMGCGGEMGTAYSCGPWESHTCTCGPPGCVPECAVSSGGISWSDPCTGSSIRPDTDCMGQEAVCGAIGSWSEGWYESASGELITWAQCANEWRCEVYWI